MENLDLDFAVIQHMLHHASVLSGKHPKSLYYATADLMQAVKCPKKVPLSKKLPKIDYKIFDEIFFLTCFVNDPNIFKDDKSFVFNAKR